MRRRLATTCLLAVAVVAVAGCRPNLARPTGAGSLRYRDAVFTAVTTTTDVVYGSAKDQKGVTTSLKMDVYAPTGDDVTARPAIVWIHGGSFKSGTKTSPEIVDEATTFAKKGYVSVSISYRLAPNTGCTSVTGECITAITDAKHDAQAAVRFLRSKASTYGIDVDRIAIAGTSAGAITALNVAYGSEDVGTSGTPGPSSKVRAAVSLSGAAILDTPAKGDPRALLFHGTADGVVPYSWATRTVGQADDVGAPIALVTFEGAGHVPYTANRTTILDTSTNFLWWALDLPHAAR